MMYPRDNEQYQREYQVNPLAFPDEPCKPVTLQLMLFKKPIYSYPACLPAHLPVDLLTDK